MSNPRTALLFFCLVALAGLAVFALMFPDLPQHVATRFDSSGQPMDEPVSKALFAAMYMGVLLLGGLYSVAAFRSLGKLPDRYLRIVPESSYWLAPERRQESLKALSAMFLWLAVLTVALFTATFGLIMAANTQALPIGTARLSTVISFLDTIYLTLLFAGAIGFKRRFRPPPKTAEAEKAEEE